MALIRDVTAKEREIHSSIIVLLDVRKEATMCIIPVVPISKFTRILTSTGKLFAGEGSLQNNLKDFGTHPRIPFAFDLVLQGSASLLQDVYQNVTTIKF